MYKRLITTLACFAVTSSITQEPATSFQSLQLLPGGVYKEGNNGSARVEEGELGSVPPATYEVPQENPWTQRPPVFSQEYNHNLRNSYHPQLRNPQFNGPRGGPYNPDYRDPRFGAPGNHPYEPSAYNRNSFGPGPYNPNFNGHRGYNQQPYPPQFNGYPQSQQSYPPQYNNYPQQPYPQQYNNYPDSEQGSIERTWQGRPPHQGFSNRFITPQGIYNQQPDGNRRQAYNFFNPYRPDYRGSRRPFYNQPQNYPPDYPFSNTAPIQFDNQ